MTCQVLTLLFSLSSFAAGGDAVGPGVQSGDPIGAAMLAARRAPDTFIVRLDTTEGEALLAIHRAWSPHGADRFYALVVDGFYDDATFFRVVKGFMVQFGLPGDQALSAAWEYAHIHDDPVRQSNTRGRLSFATGGPNGRTTQVFVNLADNPGLDRQGFSPFGEVVQGMDVIDKLFRRYGDSPPRGRGPIQSRIRDEGEGYLQRFPKLDRIVSMSIVPTPAEATTTANPH